MKTIISTNYQRSALSRYNFTLIHYCVSIHLLSKVRTCYSRWENETRKLKH